MLKTFTLGANFTLAPAITAQPGARIELRNVTLVVPEAMFAAYVDWLCENWQYTLSAAIDGEAVVWQRTVPSAGPVSILEQSRMVPLADAPYVPKCVAVSVGSAEELHRVGTSTPCTC